MRSSFALRAPVVVLPLPDLTMMQVRVVLARRREKPIRGVSVSRVFAPMVVRVLRAVAQAVVHAPRKAVTVVRRFVLTVEAARPPPASEAA